MWSRIGRGPRIAAVAALLLLAAVSALGSRHAVARRSPPTTAVAVARHDLPAGSLVHDDDLRAERWPRAVASGAGFGPSTTFAGHRLAGPVARGEPLTSDRMLDGRLIRGLSPGLMATTVTLADPHATALVRAGEHVDLLATLTAGIDPDGASVDDPSVYSADDTGTAHDGTPDDSSTVEDSGGGAPQAQQQGAGAVRTAAQDLLVLAVLPPTADTGPALVVATDRATVLRLTGDARYRSFTAVVVSP